MKFHCDLSYLNKLTLMAYIILIRIFFGIHENPVTPSYLYEVD